MLPSVVYDSDLRCFVYVEVKICHSFFISIKFGRAKLLGTSRLLKTTLVYIGQ